jgi:shikimate kinase
MKISLIGFMGAGKTTIGKLLAEKLDLNLVEMDGLILKSSKEKSINDIFAKKGEIFFRELEIAVGKSLCKAKDVVISTSGGVVINKIIIDHLKMNKGKIIFLKTSLPEVKKRLKNDQVRPLFKDKKLIKKMFIFRQPLYEQYADFIVPTDERTIEEVVISILKLL